MFTYLKLKNFKSLKDITLNLKETQKKTKNFVAIYGENGCGKTNLVIAFETLKRTLLSKTLNRRIQNMIENIDDFRDLMETDRSFFKKFDTSIKLDELRMRDERKPTEIEYGFVLDGIEGYYYLKFDKTIKEERLYHIVGKQRAVLFEIKYENNEIKKMLNSNIFKGKKYSVELEEEIDKYWGKHTFLSIMNEELVRKNKEFVEENVSYELLDVLNDFLEIGVKHDKASNILDVCSKLYEPLKLEEGEIDTKSTKILDKYEKILKIFFLQAYSDIKDVYYERKIGKKEIKYKLYFKKLIANKVRIISYKDESNGTRKILEQFNYMIEAINGKTIVIDEIDNGIHDLLIRNIIMSMKDEITGQLIITTHNTLLLENLSPKELYIITVDHNGDKEVNCITDYDMKVQKNNNVRDLYFKGLFGGIPMGNYIDFEEIKYALEDADEEEV